MWYLIVSIPDLCNLTYFTRHYQIPYTSWIFNLCIVRKTRNLTDCHQSDAITYLTTGNNIIFHVLVMRIRRTNESYCNIIGLVLLSPLLSYTTFSGLTTQQITSSRHVSLKLNKKHEYCETIFWHIWTLQIIIGCCCQLLPKIDHSLNYCLH